MQFETTQKIATGENFVLLRNCLHARDVAPLRWGRRPLPWADFIAVAPIATRRLPLMDGEPAVSSIICSFKTSGHIHGFYQQDTREINVSLGNINSNPNPQMAAHTIAHEIAHALLHWNMSHYEYTMYRSTYVEAECQAELVAITTLWLMGYQLPAVAFGLIHDLTQDLQSKRVYHILVDTYFEHEILQTAEMIAYAFKGLLQ